MSEQWLGSTQRGLLYETTPSTMMVMAEKSGCGAKTGTSIAAVYKTSKQPPRQKVGHKRLSKPIQYAQTVAKRRKVVKAVTKNGAKR